MQEQILIEKIRRLPHAAARLSQEVFREIGENKADAAYDKL